MKSVTRRRIELAGRQVDYDAVLSKVARQTRARVGPTGVEVVQPVAASDEAVSAFLRRNENWILAQLDRVARLGGVMRPVQRACGEMLYRGKATQVRVEFADTRARGNRVSWTDGEIVVRRGAKTHTPVVRGLENWLRNQARSAVTAYLPEVTARIGVVPRRVYVMGQRTKWGSCSSCRNLSFNWRLILAPDFVLRYLVTHEAVHLVVPDHSARFWLTVQSLCPDTEHAKQWLSRHQAELAVNLETVVGSPCAPSRPRGQDDVR